MRRTRIGLFIFILLVIYIIYKPIDFERYLENSIDKFSKEISQANTIFAITRIEDKYKLLVYEYVFEEKKTDKDYKFDQVKFDSFLRQIHKRSYIKKETIRRRVCHDIVKERREYFELVTRQLDKINIDNIKNVVSQFNQFHQAILENNCTQKLEKFKIDAAKTFQKLRDRMVIIFIDSLQIEALSVRYKKILQKGKKDLQNKANNIAKEYGKEIVGLHPIIRCTELGDRDKKIAEEYLIEPFKVAVKDYTLATGNQINIDTLEFISTVYEEFINFCEKNSLHFVFKKEDFSFIQPYKVLEFSSDFVNDYREEGMIWNTLDEALGFVPIFGDAKEFLGINICKDEDENTYEAKRDLNKKIQDMTKTIEQNLNTHRSNLILELYKKLAISIETGEGE